ncbi:sensor histidine kinase [Pendulispora albinea]|uniref:histidine kinase n=1 Tax=Pendulispora albinea TaxID=2741071 RepID=A0ABZ2M0G1_9BACT
MAAKSLSATRTVTGPGSTSRTFGDIAPVLVHDFKGPLSAVALNLDFVLEQLPPDSSFDSVRGALSECRHASDRIFRVIANLIDVSRWEEGRLALRCGSVVLPELFRRVVASHEVELAQSKVDMRIEVRDDLPAIDADADLLARVLHNLIDNALRNAKPHGTIVLSAHVSATRDVIELGIKNDGPPVPHATRAALFVRAVGTTEADGLGLNRGLGLYFCKLALEALGATIALSEEPGFPVAFVIRYPMPVRPSR